MSFGCGALSSASTVAALMEMPSAHGLHGSPRYGANMKSAYSTVPGTIQFSASVFFMATADSGFPTGRAPTIRILITG
jgi:hypothetical protein